MPNRHSRKEDLIIRIQIKRLNRKTISAALENRKAVQESTKGYRRKTTPELEAILREEITKDKIPRDNRTL